MRPLVPRSVRLLSTAPCPSTAAATKKRVKLVEVSPRDGLQNEKTLLPAEVKVELVRRLVESGMADVEAGSFVSPKWVPQMSTTPLVLSSPVLSSLRLAHPSLSLPVLVPNARGLSSLLSLQASHSSAHPADPPLTREVAVFVSATEGFSRANLNCDVATSLAQLEPVFETAKAHGLRVRAYVSVVLGCPFEGAVESEKPAEVAKRLVEMGAYEVSLGDTVGVGVPVGWERLVNECERRGVGVDKLAIHAHDTYGTAIASILHCVSLGLTTVDASLAALGGCPYSPGATGNVSTEDVLYALSASGIPTTVLPDPDVAAGEGWSLVHGVPGERQKRFEELCDVGEWVSQQVGRKNGSRAGRAVRGRKERERAKREKEKEGEGRAKL